MSIIDVTKETTITTTYLFFWKYKMANYCWKTFYVDVHVHALYTCIIQSGAIDKNTEQREDPGAVSNKSGDEVPAKCG